MGFFNNIGNEIDIANVKVSKYIEGTPKMKKWKREKVDPIIDDAASEMSDYWKKIYKKEIWDVISEGLSEDMFYDNGDLDPNVLKIVNIRLHAFRKGWRAVTEN